MDKNAFLRVLFTDLFGSFTLRELRNSLEETAEEFGLKEPDLVLRLNEEFLNQKSKEACEGSPR
ncbi:MAG: hypothetical protein WC609_03150 [Candidatus Paceibacterota bacterium]|jgi:hypothetical protein